MVHNFPKGIGRQKKKSSKENLETAPRTEVIIGDRDRKRGVYGVIEKIFLDLKKLLHPSRHKPARIRANLH